MGRRTTLPHPWRDLAKSAGGVLKLADALGVNYRTIENWGKGSVPQSEAVRDYVAAFAYRRGIVVQWGAPRRRCKAAA